MKHTNALNRFSEIGHDERGVSFMAVMMLTLMVGGLGVAALTMTGLENSMAGAVRMVEEGTAAAESCIGTAVRVINLVQDDPGMGSEAAVVIAPQGPVPAGNANFLKQEINGTLRNNQDVAVGPGKAPNLTLRVNNYDIDGDIDFLYAKKKAGDNLADVETLSDIFTYRVDCTAANAATGATSRVIAVYDCLGKTGDGCTKRPGV
jgi:Tfp pilus assembly protein PilX